jgi:hypothetical protein
MPRNPRGGKLGRPPSALPTTAAERIERGEYASFPAEKRVGVATLAIYAKQFVAAKPAPDVSSISDPDSVDARRFRELRDRVREEFWHLPRRGGLRKTFGPGSQLAEVMGAYRKKRDAAVGFKVTNLAQALIAIGWMDARSGAWIKPTEQE